DTDSEHTTGLQHAAHHLKTRVHELHPLGVSCGVVPPDELTEVRVIGVFVPLVVVPEVESGVVRRVSEDEVHPATLSVQGGERLEVVALDDEVPRTPVVIAHAVRLDRLLNPWPHLPSD